MAPTMRWLSLVACLLASTNANPIGPRAQGPDDVLAAKALENAKAALAGTLSDGITRKECTKDNVKIRKEYGDMSKDERADYVKAVNCLFKAPSKLSATKYPGAKNRYDDFVVVHMNMTPSVHGTANFLHWHRYYIWAYEEALRNECGYKGTQPYWNWGKYAEATSSPIWNGDQYSMGGNGEKVKHTSTMAGMNGQRVPAGDGGGCVTTGPFGNMTVNLGPVMGTMDSALKIPRNPRADGYGYNPRCLRRDVNNFFTKTYLTSQRIADQLTGATDLAKFQDTIQNDAATGFCLHTSGHYTIWGDPGGDVYVSPGDPTFWLHHGQLDRHWWIWQNQDPAKRVTQYMGGTVWMAVTSPAGKTTDPQWLDVVDPKGKNGGVPSSDLMSTTAGPFCYLYQ